MATPTTLESVLSFDSTGNAVFVGGITMKLPSINGGVVIANSGGTLNASNGTNGQLLIGGGIVPAWATLSSPNSTVTLTTGTNSLGLDIANYVARTVWTPVLSFGGATTGITYGTQSGVYLRIGGIVIFAMNMVLTSKGTATGNMAITGLPFSANTITSLNIQSGNLTYAAGDIQASITGNTISVFNNVTALAAALLTNTFFGNTTSLQISGTIIL